MRNSTDTDKYYAALASVRAMTPARFKRLKIRYGSAEAVWHASINDMLVCDIDRATAEWIANDRASIDPLRVHERMLSEGIGVVSSDDERYPALLKEISQPPFALFYRGSLPAADAFMFAIVGTRAFTQYGSSITPGLVSDLVQNGFAIVSGMARGIDTIVHASCIERGGTAVAVLGTGLDNTSIYPPQNRKLAQQIIANGGCLLSEYAPSMRVQGYHFPARNRIISGLCRGVAIIEAAERSGAMITARHALDQNRDVFAVPGPIYNPMSAGPHALIKQGAIPLTSSADICDHYSRYFASRGQQRMLIGENEHENILLKILSQNPLTIDEVCRMCDLDTRIVASTLMIMEMKRMVRNIGAMRYIRST